MKITKPFPDTAISQGFGLNGHTGIDYDMPYGTTIKSVCDGWCFSTLNKNNPNLMAYQGVYVMGDDSDFSYEISYGHCSYIGMNAPEPVVDGEPIANIGNTGMCYVGERLVTKAEKDAGSTAGAHLHFQVRKCKRVAETTKGKKYIEDENGKLLRNGMYYEVVDNEYRGCIDPRQFFANYQLTRNLSYGSWGHDVIELQKRLGVSPTWYIFGPKTRAAVIQYQQAHGIEPTGFCGPITRASLNT